MRRLLLPALVLLALVLAVVGACAASPPGRLPAVALGAALVWRVEVATALFATAYVVIVAVRLSWHGRTFTRIGSGGVEVPDLRATVAAEREAQIVTADLSDSVVELAAALERYEIKLDAIERAIQVLLHRA